MTQASRKAATVAASIRSTTEVWISPGATQLTLTSGANSLASERVSAATAAFAAA